MGRFLNTEGGRWCCGSRKRYVRKLGGLGGRFLLLLSRVQVFLYTHIVRVMVPSFGSLFQGVGIRLWIARKERGSFLVEGDTLVHKL